MACICSKAHAHHLVHACVPAFAPPCACISTLRLSVCNAPPYTCAAQRAGVPWPVHTCAVCALLGMCTTVRMLRCSHLFLCVSCPACYCHTGPWVHKQVCIMLPLACPGSLDLAYSPSHSLPPSLTLHPPLCAYIWACVRFGALVGTCRWCKTRGGVSSPPIFNCPPYTVAPRAQHYGCKHAACVVGVPSISLPL